MPTNYQCICYRHRGQFITKTYFFSSIYLLPITHNHIFKMKMSEICLNTY